MRNKIWGALKKFIGIEPEPAAWRPQGVTLPGPVWRPRRGVHRKVRRLALGPDVRRRKARDEFIRHSQLQGVEIAAKRRAAQLRDREEGGHLYMQAFRRSQRSI
jgi:hypothetical protein